MRRQRVLKFGGAALADGRAVRRVCGIVAQRRAADGVGPVVVVSAHQGVTDQLEQLALAAATGRPDEGPVRLRHRSLLAQLDLPAALLDRYWRALTASLEGVRRRGRIEPAELDLALSFGERLSARIVARALGRHGVAATAVDAWDLGLVTDSRHGCARPLEGVARAIRSALADVPGVPVVTGFLAKDPAGQLTTLGRDGSDLTAAIIAEAIEAAELQYWKTVPGILTADPALVPEARLLAQVTYEEAGELAFHGARVLHPAAVAPARRARVPVRVANVAEPDEPGTILVESTELRGPRALASRAPMLAVRLTVDAPERRGERCARLLAALEACGVTPAAIAAHDRWVEALVEPGPGVPAALAQLGPDASVERDLATLALVGQGVGTDTELMRRCLRRLQRAAVQVRRVLPAAGGTSLAWALDATDLRGATRALHAELTAAAPAEK